MIPGNLEPLNVRLRHSFTQAIRDPKMKRALPKNPVGAGSQLLHRVYRRTTGARLSEEKSFGKPNLK
jgi:hypothetical protein